MASSLAKAELLISSVLPQIVAQLGSVLTFGDETVSSDIESVKAAQKTCDRFLNGIREVAVAEKMETTVRDLIALVVGDEFDFSTADVWSWRFPTIIRTSSDLQIILRLALGGLPEVISVLKSKKRKAPERDEDEANKSLTNEMLLSAFPQMEGSADTDKLREMMKNLKMDPSNLREQQHLKDAAAAIAAGTDPKQLHKTASGAQDLAGLNRLFTPNSQDRELAINEDGQIVARTSGNSDNRYLWNLKINGLIESMPRDSESRKKAMVYRDSFGPMGEYFPWPTVMTFDTHFRELISSGAVRLCMRQSLHGVEGRLKREGALHTELPNIEYDLLID